MLKEFHYNDSFSWPNKSRIAVTLTFDFQGGEDVRPLPNGTINHEEYTQCEYGPNTGDLAHPAHPRGGEASRRRSSPAAASPSAIPEAVKAIVGKGHEIAGHGYHHEVARDLTREQERDVMRRTATWSTAAPAYGRSAGAPAPRARTASSC